MRQKQLHKKSTRNLMQNMNKTGTSTVLTSSSDYHAYKVIQFPCKIEAEDSWPVKSSSLCSQKSSIGEYLGSSIKSTSSHL